MLGMGREDEDVDTEVGTGGCGESELSDFTLLYLTELFYTLV